MNKLPQSFLALFFLFPIADVINGWLISEGFSFKFGVMYRIVVLLYSFFLLLKKQVIRNNKMFFLVFINVLFFISISLVQSIYFTNSMATVFSEVTSLTKYFLGLIIIMVFIEYPLEKAENLRILLNINIFFVLGLLIPYFLHVGNYTYENSTAGYKGFYFATNDITYTLVILITLVIFHLIDSYALNNGKRRFLFWGLIFTDILSLFLIGTKFGLVYIIVIVSYLIFHLLLKNNYVPSHIKLLVFQFTIIATLLIALIGYKFILSSLDGIINRIIYFYHYYDGDLIKIITSSRSIYLEGAFKKFFRFS
ncbi:MAG: O-antigen ligase family protein [Lactobacillus sp.]|nr:O-antigen ligase family protein [Lactobacillus sp.]